MGQCQKEIQSLHLWEKVQASNTFEVLRAQYSQSLSPNSNRGDRENAHEDVDHDRDNDREGVHGDRDDDREGGVGVTSQRSTHKELMMAWGSITGILMSTQAAITQHVRALQCNKH